MYIFIVLIIILLLGFLMLDPKLDYIVVSGKKKRILWYNSSNGRNWIFLT